MVHHSLGRRQPPRTTCAAGAATAAAVATAAVAIMAVAAAATAVAVAGARHAVMTTTPPRSAAVVQQPVTLPVPAVRALDVAAIGNTFFEPRWERQDFRCPRTFFLGNATSVVEVLSPSVRLFPGEGIHHNGSLCVGGGLLVATW